MLCSWVVVVNFDRISLRRLKAMNESQHKAAVAVVSIGLLNEVYIYMMNSWGGQNHIRYLLEILAEK